MKKMLKNNLVLCVIILGMISLGLLFAGDVVVQEGCVDVSDDLVVAGKLGIGTTSPAKALQIVEGEVSITGPDGTGSDDAPDVLVVTGGTGGASSPYGKGGNIILTAGDGTGKSEGGDFLITGGDGGPDWDITQGNLGGDVKILGGTGGSIADGGNVYIDPGDSVAGTDGDVLIGSVNTNLEVSIGASSVTGSKLYVYQFLINGYAGNFFNDGGAAINYGIKVQGGTDDASGDNRLIDLFDGDGTLEGGIEIDDGVVQLWNYSDSRLKDNIVDMQADSLSLINNLRVREFSFKEHDANDPNRTHIGFVAQEVKDYIPEAVALQQNTFVYDHLNGEEVPESLKQLYDANSTIIKSYESDPNQTTIETESYIYRQSRLIPHLVKSVQQLTARLEEAEAEIQALKEQLDQ